MRELEEAIFRAAEIALAHYLGGGNQTIRDLIDIPFIAFVYDADADEIFNTIEGTFMQLLAGQ